MASSNIDMLQSVILGFIQISDNTKSDMCVDRFSSSQPDICELNPGWHTAPWILKNADNMYVFSCYSLTAVVFLVWCLLPVILLLILSVMVSPSCYSLTYSVCCAVCLHPVTLLLMLFVCCGVCPVTLLCCLLCVCVCVSLNVSRI